MVTSLDRLSEGAFILVDSAHVQRFSSVLGVRPEDLPVSNVALHAYFFTVTCAYCFLVKNTTNTSVTQHGERKKIVSNRSYVPPRL